jgi:mevalonate kinase
MSERIYPAKLLLFGEHVLLRGATALAVPVPRFSGRWMRAESSPRPRQWTQLDALLSTLKDQNERIDVARLHLDVASGWYFASSIPEGYGLGSSGALCAGLLDRYGLGDPPTDLGVLQGQLAALEGSFHGQSSGIDPLTSWVQAPLRITNRHQIDIVPVPTWQDANQAPQVFLLDTQQARQTGPLVNWFKTQLTDNQVFANHLANHLLPAHEAMIAAWLGGDAPAFWTHLREVSAWQLAHMTPMLPQSAAIRALWELGLTDAGQNFNVKICGAGGGGFVLGFAKDIKPIAAWADEHAVRLVLPFSEG